MLRRMIQEIESEVSNDPEIEGKRMWIMTLANILIVLTNSGQLNRRSMTLLYASLASIQKFQCGFRQLSVLDDVLECALRMIQARGELLLIPMYACHLTMEGQARWYRSAMRRIFDIADRSLQLWFSVTHRSDSQLRHP